MKANELMIGDWVLHDGKPIQVDEIFGDGINADYCGGEIMGLINEDELLPIPLSPKILEKNGLKKRNNYQWEYRDEYCKIVISIASQIEIDGKILGTPPINIKIEGALFDISITDDYCVHNLQHCLKLVGIDKSIEL